MNKNKNVCAKCGENATLKCSGCKNEFYCGKDHQRLDWKRHKYHCQAWEIITNPELGKNLVAKRDLKMDDVILNESPLVWGPGLHTDNRVCVGCGKFCTSPDTRCLKCYWPACGIDCEGLLNQHALECSLFTSSCKIIPRTNILLVIRMFILWKMKSKRWTSLSELQSHEESRGPGTEAYEEVVNVCRHLSPLMNDHSNDGDILAKIYGLIDVNALETNPPEGSVALYENAGLLEHSCQANTRHNFSIDSKGRPRITVRATNSIKKGEHLSTMYTHALWTTTARRENLLSTKYFSCRCRRCKDPTELNTFLSTLKCPCKNGLIMSNDPLNFETEWSCNACSGVLSSLEVRQLTDRLGEEVEEAMKTPNEKILFDLLSRLTKLLHPCHQHCITVGHSLIQLLPPNQLKQELCERIIRVVTILDPYGTRLALYTAIALRELSTCTEGRKKDLLSRAISLLKYEPLDSPGDKLKKLIQPELLSVQFN